MYTSLYPPTPIHDPTPTTSRLDRIRSLPSLPPRLSQSVTPPGGMTAKQLKLPHDSDSNLSSQWPWESEKLSLAAKMEKWTLEDGKIAMNRMNYDWPGHGYSPHIRTCSSHTNTSNNSLYCSSHPHGTEQDSTCEYSESSSPLTPSEAWQIEQDQRRAFEDHLQGHVRSTDQRRAFDDIQGHPRSADRQAYSRPTAWLERQAVLPLPLPLHASESESEYHLRSFSPTPPPFSKSHPSRNGGLCFAPKPLPTNIMSGCCHGYGCHHSHMTSSPNYDVMPHYASPPLSTSSYVRPYIPRLVYPQQQEHQHDSLCSPRSPCDTLLGFCGSGGGPSPKNKKAELYKTELCRSWNESNQCRYNTRCQFAHGMQELRAVPRNSKFKTEACRIFERTALCEFGGRCLFKHEEHVEDNYRH